MRTLTLALGIILLTATLGAAPAARVYTGVVTDTMCGSDHRAMKIDPVPTCVTECVRHDKQVRYALHDGKNTYVLSDQETPAKFAGRKVKVTGALYEKTGIIKVETIEAVR